MANFSYLTHHVVFQDPEAAVPPEVIPHGETVRLHEVRDNGHLGGEEGLGLAGGVCRVTVRLSTGEAQVHAPEERWSYVLESDSYNGKTFHSLVIGDP